MRGVALLWSIPLLSALQVGVAHAEKAEKTPASQSESHGEAAKPAANAEASAKPDGQSEEGAAKPEAHGEAPSQSPHGTPGMGFGKPGWEKKCPNSVPCPRRVAAPKIDDESFEPVGDEAPSEWNYQEHRFSLLMLVSSWNERSAELARTVRKYAPKFRKRQIGILALASHDSRTELKNWRRLNGISFPTGLASLSFTKAHENPKVPTIWVADGRGDLLIMRELPTDTDFETILDNLLLWTDF